ncbi:MAG: hypothetical protein N2235_26285, partial [Fischerella sp.]|nr:hypothetical protein [Fischerella sp.]
MKLSLETLLESISDKNLWVKFLKLAKNYTEYDSRNSRKVRNNLKKHSIIKVTGGVLNKEVLFFTITLDNGREYLVVKDFVNY